MRKMWYKFNVWRYDRKVNSMCKLCIAFSPIMCDGLESEHYDDMCPEMRLLLEKLCYYKNCYRILDEQDRLKRKLYADN